MLTTTNTSCIGHFEWCHDLVLLVIFPKIFVNALAETLCIYADHLDVTRRCILRLMSSWIKFISNVMMHITYNHEGAYHYCCYCIWLCPFWFIPAIIDNMLILVVLRRATTPSWWWCWSDESHTVGYISSDEDTYLWWSHGSYHTTDVIYHELGHVYCHMDGYVLETSLDSLPQNVYTRSWTMHL